MPGPRPTPTKILKARGSWRANGRKDEPQPEATIPPAPAVLAGKAMEEWDRVAPVLHATGCLTLVDMAVLATYCQAFADWQQAIEEITKTGPVVRAPSGFAVQNPYVSLKNQAAKQMLACAAELGLSPSARTRIKVEAPSEEKKDGKGRFFVA